MAGIGAHRSDRDVDPVLEAEDAVEHDRLEEGHVLPNRRARAQGPVEARLEGEIRGEIGGDGGAAEEGDGGGVGGEDADRREGYHAVGSRVVVRLGRIGQRRLEACGRLAGGGQVSGRDARERREDGAPADTRTPEIRAQFV